jgi:uncharacterized protein
VKTFNGTPSVIRAGTARACIPYDVGFMNQDLHAPLGLKTMHRTWWNRIPFGLLGVLMIAAVLSVGIVWVSFLPEPFGGQPVAVVRVDRSKTGIALKDIEVATPGHTPAKAGGTEAAHKGAPAGEAATEAGGHGAEPAHSGAKIINVPQEPEPNRYQGMPQDGQSLPTISVARVTDQNGKYGPLPKVAGDGTRPLEVYARPPQKKPGTAPRVVIVVGGLGLSQTGTQEAIRLLPPDVTLAFAPYGSSLDRWTARARQDGHELLLQVPMEPFDYPDSDPGPQTLLSNLSADENADRLRWLMARMTTYVGIVNYMGGKFSSSEDLMQPLMREVATRGLMYLDDGSSTRSAAGTAARPTRTPFAQADLVLDAQPTEEGIDARLAQLEGLARQKGLAIGTASALPVSIRRISEWAKGIDSRGVFIVPVSAAVRDGQG